MSKIPYQCEYSVGPYKGYYGRAIYYQDDKLFHGDVIGTSDVITFAGKKLDELSPAFQASVDDYLEFCEELGRKPEKPHSGKLVLRISPELHQKIAIAAKANGKSLNQFISGQLESSVVGTSAKRQTKSITLARKHVT